MDIDIIMLSCSILFIPTSVIYIHLRIASVFSVDLQLLLISLVVSMEVFYRGFPPPDCIWSHIGIHGYATERSCSGVVDVVTICRTMGPES